MQKLVSMNIRRLYIYTYTLSLYKYVFINYVCIELYGEREFIYICKLREKVKIK